MAENIYNGCVCVECEEKEDGEKDVIEHRGDLVDTMFDNERYKSKERLNTAVNFYQTQNFDDLKGVKTLDYVENNFNSVLQLAEENDKLKEQRRNMNLQIKSSKIKLRVSSDYEETIKALKNYKSNDINYFINGTKLTSEAYYQYKNRKLFNSHRMSSHKILLRKKLNELKLRSSALDRNRIFNKINLPVKPDQIPNTAQPIRHKVRVNSNESVLNKKSKTSQNFYKSEVQTTNFTSKHSLLKRTSFINNSKSKISTAGSNINLRKYERITPSGSLIQSRLSLHKKELHQSQNNFSSNLMHNMQDLRRIGTLNLTGNSLTNLKVRQSYDEIIPSVIKPKVMATKHSNIVRNYSSRRSNKRKLQCLKISKECDSLMKEGKKHLFDFSIEQFKTQVAANDFDKTLLMARSLDLTTTDAYNLVYDYMTNTFDDDTQTQLKVVREYNIGKADPTRIVAKLERQAKKAKDKNKIFNCL